MAPWQRASFAAVAAVALLLVAAATVRMRVPASLDTTPQLRDAESLLRKYCLSVEDVDGGSSVGKQLDAVVQQQRSASSWNMYYSEMAEFLSREFKGHAGISMAEIGHAYGGLGFHLLMNVPVIKYYHAIDPYIATYDLSDATSAFYKSIMDANGLSGDRFSMLWATSVARSFEQFGSRYCLHRALSTTGAAQIADSSLDVVFIDGLHTAGGVRDDTNAWHPKVKVGGLMIFNDYGHPEFPGVKDEVDRFAARLSASLQYIGDASHNNVYLYKRV